MQNIFLIVQYKFIISHLFKIEIPYLLMSLKLNLLENDDFKWNAWNARTLGECTHFITFQVKCVNAQISAEMQVEMRNNERPLPDMVTL